MITATPQSVAPAAANNSKKPLPAVPRKALEAGFHCIHYDFHGSGVNPLIHARFNRAGKFYYSFTLLWLSGFSGFIRVNPKIIYLPDLAHWFTIPTIRKSEFQSIIRDTE